MQQSHSLTFRRWLVSLSLIVGIAAAGRAESVTVDGMTFELYATSRTAALTATTDDLGTDVVIPATVTYNGAAFTVTDIRENSFKDKTNLISVSIPGTVTSVGSIAWYQYDYSPFKGCSSLRNVRFEDGTDDDIIYMGAGYDTSYQGTGHSLFDGLPLEEVYIGRHIKYMYNASNYTYSAKECGYSPFYNIPTLTRVTFGPKVTEIEDYLFMGNKSITLMSFPNVERIGEYAFGSCGKLTTVNLGTALQTVGNGAFSGCRNITKLTFPDATTTIGDWAFNGCTSVTEITVGSGLKSIGKEAFRDCGSFTAIILPDNFTTMEEGAFKNCTKLTIAKLGKSLTSIPLAAFKNCTALSEMFIPASVTSIGNEAFYNDSGIASLTMEEGLKTIGSQVFYNNSGLMRMEIPGTVTSIGQNSFYGCTRLTYLTFRDGDETLNINNLFSESVSTTKTCVYDYFYDCPIRFLTIGRNITYQYSNGTDVAGKYKASAPFADKTSIVSVTFGPKVTFLYHHLLNGCSGIKKVTLPAGLEQAYSYCLANCPQIPELIFPEPLVLLDDYACSGNTALATVEFKETPGNDLCFAIGNRALAYCPALTELTFPTKTVSIGNYCFYKTPGLKSITFIDTPRSIFLGNEGAYPLFKYSNIESLYMGRNIDYDGADTMVPNEDLSNAPFSGQQYLSDVRFSQAGTVTYCKNCLLYNVPNCARLTLPESLKSIGDYTFARMKILNGITIPNAVTTMGKYAFSGDSELKFAKLSTSCAWLKEGLFSDCTSLESITIPPVVTKMDGLMFRNCSALTSATFEGNKELLTMGYGASQADFGLFRDCPLETLNLDRWLSYNTDQPARSPFYSIKELKNLTLGENVGVVDKYMFSYCTGLEEVYLPDNIESIGLWGFRGCSSLKSVRLSQKLSQVSDYGFSECTSLDNVVFPASMTSVADNSFSNCTSLKKLDLGQSLNIIGPAAFKNDVALEGIVIPETLYGLGVEAFANCTSLPNVTIRSITSVGKQSFQGCTGLQWVSLSEKTTSLGENSFDGCTGIKYVKSFADFPPEGLVNFPADVVAAGTLFVPEASMDYYQYSPTWENWMSIRPITDNVLVSSVTFDVTEHSFKAAETLQLTVTVGADNATDKNLRWSSSDESVATVDETGLVTAVFAGEAIISATATDGSGVKAECRVTVDPTPVESISIAADSNTLKKTRKMLLTPTVLPATATNTELRWQSSDIRVATVDSEGNVTAVFAGETTITATATDGTGIKGMFTLTVVNPTKGDSNDNDQLTITDAVNTANYSIGHDVAEFCFEAADVNGDNRITLADATGTVSLILDAPATQSMRMQARTASADTDADRLVIDDYAAAAGQIATVAVKLDNTIDYVALQADIRLPEGMTLVEVKAGERAEANHSLMQKRIGANTVRVALFDLSNSAFADIDGSLLELTVKTDASDCSSIVISNIIAADADANEFTLTSTGGNNGTTGIEGIAAGTVTIEAGADGVIISNAAGKEVGIFTANGMTVARFTATADVETYRLASGIYIVTADGITEKVIVK